MKVQIWHSFSCNNSSDYRLVARFADPVVAAAMRDELRAFFAAYGAASDRYFEDNDGFPEDEPLPVAAEFAARHGFAWDAQDILGWGDEGMTDDQPTVEAVGGTLAIYHDYCGGFSGNLVRALTARGAEVEPEERKPPELSARFVLPDGDAGEQMASELATFFAQKSTKSYMSDFGAPPWGGRLGGNPADIHWYRDGQRFAFKLPFPPAGLDDLKRYLAGAGVGELDLRLCDERELASFEMRDTLLELDAVLAAGTPVTQLEIADRRLRYLPPQVLAMPDLRELVLRGNPLTELPAELARLTALEVLDLSGCKLTTLPDELAGLTRLRVLDLSRNPLRALPPVIARLPGLRELRVAHLRGVDLSLLAELTELEVLDLSYLRPEGNGLIEFPREVLGLGKLRSLDLSTGALASIPDEIAGLSALESLRLGAVLGGNQQLPPLHRLPKLTALAMSGNAGNTGAYAPVSVLDGVWQITTLEHLGIDRYGPEKGKREGLTELPDDAFARMPRLKTLDLSFNPLTRLPESFYALTELSSVDLQYTKLDRATLDRLATACPRVKLDLRHVTTRFDVDDPHWAAVRAHVKAGSARLAKDHAGALAEFDAALALCTPGAVYSDYDELYANYGCTYALEHLRLAAQGDERAVLGDRLVAHATRALELAPLPGTGFHFSDETAFHDEVNRRAGNALAWLLMERGELDRALAVVERALSAGGVRGYVFDTKVRILLAAGRDHEAYPIVDAILAEDPGFKDFQDLKIAPAYLAWRATRRG